MNKKIIATLVLSGLLVAGMGFYFGQSLKPADQTDQAVVEPATPVASDAATSAADEPIDFSLPDLDGNGSRWQCSETV